MLQHHRYGSGAAGFICNGKAFVRGTARFIVGSDFAWTVFYLILAGDFVAQLAELSSATASMSLPH